MKPARAYRIQTDRLPIWCYSPEDAPGARKTAFATEGMRWVEIRYDPENVRSYRVAQKLGFTHEATLRERDVMLWSLFRKDYDALPELRRYKIKAFDVTDALL